MPYFFYIMTNKSFLSDYFGGGGDLGYAASAKSSPTRVRHVGYNSLTGSFAMHFYENQLLHCH